jgi:chromosome segregation ATPase
MSLQCPACQRNCISDYDFLNHDCDYERSSKRIKKTKHEKDDWKTQRLVMENMGQMETIARMEEELVASKRFISLLENQVRELETANQNFQSANEALQSRVFILRDAPYEMQKKLDIQHQEQVDQMTQYHHNEMERLVQKHNDEMETFTKRLEKTQEEEKRKRNEEFQNLASKFRIEQDEHMQRVENLSNSFEKEKLQIHFEFGLQKQSMERKNAMLENELKVKEMQYEQNTHLLQVKLDKLIDEHASVALDLRNRITYLETEKLKFLKTLEEQTKTRQKLETDYQSLDKKFTECEALLHQQKTDHSNALILVRKEMLSTIAQREMEIRQELQDELEKLENQNLLVMEQNKQVEILQKKVNALEISNQELQKSSQQHMELYRKEKKTCSELEQSLQQLQNLLSRKDAILDDNLRKAQETQENLEHALREKDEQIARLTADLEELNATRKEVMVLKKRYDNMVDMSKKSIDALRSRFRTEEKLK